MESSVEEIKNLADRGELEDAIRLLDIYIRNNPQADEAYFLRGRLRWRAGDRSGATSDYAHASAINPESGAVRALEMARDIESFFNPDLLNP
ncbi:MAG: tetratricopeptide repeat protein [Paramuribaculum sp.]|nr:tetratricopeptide repeat protein [Bacteroides sp.]MDE7461011.1 tetratricopeptide repeat protein [Paramuribaculum sp.]